MIRTLLLSLLLALALVSPAAAHKLKVFAAIEGNDIAGYAFFIGGGRAQETPWVAKDASGAVIAEGTTDADGVFRLTPPAPVASDITITVNTQEGHIAAATLAAARFGAGSAEAAPAAAAVAAPESGAPSDPATASADVAVLVEAAVQRQVEPLLERIEQMDDRLRYSDILAGIFLIVGLAGIGLWARGLRRK